MTAYVTTAAGRTFQLPVPLSWELNYTAGVPSDSCWVRCPWQASQGTDPAEWVRFSAAEAGETVFSGVVDECEVNQGTEGLRLEVSGRGMAALLLDNEALGQDYGTATLEDILRDHVAPYGIELAGEASLPAVSPFSVPTGSSEWAVLYEFAQYCGGVCPRFDRAGRLVLEGWTEVENLAISDATPVTSLTVRDRRYGVLSQILVRDRVRQTVEQVEATDFLRMGGRCRRVMTMPGRSSYQAMRYSGQFQLDRSAAELVRMEAVVPVLFYGKPGDLVRIQRSDWDRNGSWRVVEASVQADEAGGRTRLELAVPDVVI